jgi:hypothetical protein
MVLRRRFLEGFHKISLHESSVLKITGECLLGENLFVGLSRISIAKMRERLAPFLA